jgi:hypothetical protein
VGGTLLIELKALLRASNGFFPARRLAARERWIIMFWRRRPRSRMKSKCKNYKLKVKK